MDSVRSHSYTRYDQCIMVCGLSFINVYSGQARVTAATCF